MSHNCTVCSYPERNGAPLLKKGGVQIKQRGMAGCGREQCQGTAPVMSGSVAHRREGRWLSIFVFIDFSNWGEKSLLI